MLNVLREWPLLRGSGASSLSQLTFVHFVTRLTMLARSVANSSHSYGKAQNNQALMS